jgi:hypothetical protein
MELHTHAKLPPSARAHPPVPLACPPAAAPALFGGSFARSTQPTAATGRPMGTTLLQSLQRRFVTQSQLETPALPDRES